MLPDQDSNLDKQYQKLSYYHYTIGQSLIKECKYSRVIHIFQTLEGLFSNFFNEE